jgi:hypothetical protein
MHVKVRRLRPTQQLIRAFRERRDRQTLAPVGHRASRSAAVICTAERDSPSGGLGWRVARGGRPRIRWPHGIGITATGGTESAGCLATGPAGRPAAARILRRREASQPQSERPCVRPERSPLKTRTSSLVQLG